MNRRRSWFAAAVALPLVACSTAGTAPGAAPVASATRTTLAVEGDPNGIYWDAKDGALLLADDDGNRILRWSDGAGFSVAAQLPEAPPGGAGLGQVVRLPDGALVVTRFGHGRGGDVAVISAQGEVRWLSGLDTARRRIGLTVAPDGTLYDAWFTKSESSGERSGGVSVLSLGGSERDVIVGLKKTVGVLAVGERLFVADQMLDQVLVSERAQPAVHRVFAGLSRPDLLAAGPDGSVFVGSAEGRVYRLSSTGEVVPVDGSFQQVRGVAYDPAGRRLFVVDHDADASDGLRHLLHIVPID